MKILIRGATLIDPSLPWNAPADLLIEEAKVAKVSTPGQISATGVDRLIDLDPSYLVVPGLIDMHVHLRDPGFPQKETLASGTLAAVSGGVTSVLAMANTDPVNDHQDVTRYVLAQAQDHGYARVFPVGAISMGLAGQKLAPLEDLKAAGCVAFSDDGRPCESTRVLDEALRQCRALNTLLIEHCEDLSLSQGHSTIHEGEVAHAMGCQGLSPVGEALDVARTLILAQAYQTRVHIAHLSTRQGLHLVEALRPFNPNISCEVTPHHLMATVDWVETHQAMAKMYPPLRTPGDRQTLRVACRDGRIDTIATDHAPHTEAEKYKPFGECANGIIGVAHGFVLCAELVREGYLSYTSLVRMMSTRPAELVGLPLGSLRPGKAADVAIFKQVEPFPLKQLANRSRSENTPFWETPVTHRPVLTLVNGRIQFEEGL